MRVISAQQISQAIKEMAIEANLQPDSNVIAALQKAKEREHDEKAIYVLESLLENCDVAAKEKLPICQDTGMAVIFADIGQQIFIDGDFEAAVNLGVAQGYKEGYLRASVVSDPLFNRVNTGNNTPAIIHTRLVPGDNLRLTIAPKGFGSENMSAIAMLSPSDGEKGVIDFIVDTAKKAGGRPCPPIVIGVGIGSDFEGAALLAKRALLRKIGVFNDDKRYADLEREVLARVNETGIGPMGWGGRTTALHVSALYAPTHIAGLPVAVNICCHVLRHSERLL